ncbi:phosphatase PAP2 family protein [Cellulomonas timonensis]|uniref:phosphatase PAP2 family protein n=1 Tax=Cellulomonas timonensis TaxID=1689271 RepID=UPI00083710AE|nr:phosphatase PAP2 family protein [Cellulomonas timonensis]
MSRTPLRSGRHDPLSTRAATRAPGRAGRLLRAAAAAAATASAVLALGLLVRDQWDPLVGFDQGAVAAATSFAAARPALVDALLAWQWAFEGRRLIFPVAAVCLLVWWRTGMRTRTWWALGTMLAAWGFANVAKEVARLARPVLDDPIAHVPGYSFPSGHASTTAAWTTALVVLIWPLLRNRWQKAGAVIGAASLTVATALDRVMLGAHYPSDVFAGAVLGVGLVLASYLGYRGWSPPHDTALTNPTDRSTEAAR